MKTGSNKQSPTNVFGTFSKKLLKIEFIRRNRNFVIIFLATWLIANVCAFIIYRHSITNLETEFFTQGTVAADKIASEVGSPLLSEYYEELDSAIKKFSNLKSLSYIAILNYEDRILSHSDPKMFGKRYDIPAQKELNSKDKDTKVLSGVTPDGSKVISFVKDVLYANQKIGKVHVVFSASFLNSDISQRRFYYTCWCLLALFSLIFTYLWLNRKAIGKASRMLKEYHDMDQIGPYVLLEKLAKGGMAELFLSDYISEDGFRKKVAVKRILPHLAENTDFIQMFTREARLAALLHHPNIVQIYDYRKINNAYLIAMEFIDGKNLGEILSALKQGVPYELAGFIIAEICKGLDYSHNKCDDLTGDPLHIVHRDISPQNMLISFRGEVKISDFGISKARSEPSLTQVGVVKGKLSYLSPEQALGEQVDARSDIYALGLVFYETLTGKRVYQFENDLDAIRSIPHTVISPVIEELPEIPIEFNDLIMKCLEKNKDLRFQSAADLLVELVRIKKSLNIYADNSSLEEFMKKHFKEKL